MNKIAVVVETRFERTYRWYYAAACLITIVLTNFLGTAGVGLAHAYFGAIIFGAVMFPPIHYRWRLRREKKESQRLSREENAALELVRTEYR